MRSSPYLQNLILTVIIISIAINLSFLYYVAKPKMEKKLTERRKHRRFNVEVGSLDMLHPHLNEKLGDILNISRGGLAYRYVPDAEQPFDSFKIDIFRVVDHIPFLKNITCKAISDFDAAKRFPIKVHKYRLRGVQFGELTESQISQLEYCIQKYTLEG